MPDELKGGVRFPNGEEPKWVVDCLGTSPNRVDFCKPAALNKALPDPAGDADEGCAVKASRDDKSLELSDWTEPEASGLVSPPKRLTVPKGVDFVALLPKGEAPPVIAGEGDDVGKEAPFQVPTDANGFDPEDDPPNPANKGGALRKGSATDGGNEGGASFFAISSESEVDLVAVPEAEATVRGANSDDDCGESTGGDRENLDGSERGKGLGLPLFYSREEFVRAHAKHGIKKYEPSQK